MYVCCICIYTLYYEDFQNLKPNLKPKTLNQCYIYIYIYIDSLNVLSELSDLLKSKFYIEKYTCNFSCYNLTFIEFKSSC